MKLYEDEDDTQNWNLELYTNFFKEYRITSEFKNLQAVFPTVGFDDFIQNEFEAKLFFELYSTNKEWYYNFPVEFVIELFRNTFQNIKIKEAPSENLKRLCFVDIERYSRAEVIFLFRKCQEWLRWNIENGFSFYEDQISKIAEMSSTSAAEKITHTNFGKLYYLIELFIDYYKSPVFNYREQPFISGQQNTNTQPPKNEEKFKTVLDIISFLKGKKGTEYMTNEHFERFVNYLKGLVFEGSVEVEDAHGVIEIKNLQKGDITYTMSVINDSLYNKRNPQIFKILSAIKGFEDLQVALKNRNLRSHTAYRNFKTYSSEYLLHNPKYV